MPKHTAKRVPADQPEARPHKPATQPNRVNDHNEVIKYDREIELEIAATAKWFKTLEHKEQDSFLASIGIRRSHPKETRHD